MSSETAFERKRPFSGQSNAKSIPVSEANTARSGQSGPAPWKSLFNFTTKANLPILILGIICSAIAGAVQPIEAYLTGKIFNGFAQFALRKYTPQQFMDNQTKFIIYQVALSGGSWVFHSFEFMFWLAFGELQAKSARDRLFHGLLERDIEWYDRRKNGIGALLPRLQTQIRDLQIATAQPLGMLVAAIAQCILSIAEAFYFSWKLTLVTLASSPVIFVALAFFSSRMQSNVVKQQAKLTEAQKYSINAFTAIETVKCFNGQDLEREKYMKRVKEAARFYHKEAFWNGLMMAMGVMLTSSMIVQGFYYGGVLIRKGEIDPGTVVTCFFAAIGGFSAFQAVMPQMLTLEKGRTAGATLRACMAEMQKGPNEKRSSGLLRPAECRGNIEVKNLTFAYPVRQDVLALDDVNMYIPSGEMTFLIGKSGSGKSTLSQLLMGFYGADQGLILVDGIPLRSLDVEWLRSNITLVEQQSLLFNDTVFNNIAFGRGDNEDVSREEVIEAVEFALLQLMISDMPEGLDTMVGYKGGTMSGGQRQRMALARARLRDTPILMLDESTSALDAISRALMIDAIRQWRRGKTTIIITHDISQILPDDYLFLLENGRLVQEGYRKHLTVLRDTPFQNFLPPDERATTLPFDARRDTEFESIYTRGSSLDFSPVDAAPSHSLFDPLEAHLDAGDNRRTSFLPPALLDSSPVPLMGAFGRFGANIGPSTSPWLRAAPDSPSTSPIQPKRQSWRQSWRQSGLYQAKARGDTKRQSAAEWSKKLELLVDRTGQFAADARQRTMGGPDRRRKLQDHDDGLALATIKEEKENEDGDEDPSDALVTIEDRKIKRLLSTVWPCLDWKSRNLLLAGFFGCTIHAVCNPLFSFVLSKLVSSYSMPGNQRSKQLLYSMFILVIAFTDAAHSWLQRFLLGCCAQTWVDNFRDAAMECVMDQPKIFFDQKENSVSHLTDCLDRYAEYMRELLAIFTGLCYTALLMSLTSVFWAISAQWKMSLIALTTAPYILGVTKIYAAVSARWESKSNDAVEDASAIFTETFTNIKTVRALTLEMHFRNKYITATNHALVVGMMRAVNIGFFFGVADSSGHFAVALVLYIGSKLASEGSKVESVIQVAVMLTFAIMGVTGILECIPQISNSTDAAARFMRLSKLQEDSHEHLGDTRIVTIGEIVFDDLHFAYPSRPDQLVLKGLTLRIQPGTCTAIVGGSGSGKSTIANLLLDIWNTTQTPRSGTIKSGELTIAGRDIQSISTTALRSLIVTVAQTPTIFAATVAENIAYGLPADSSLNNMSEVMRAADRAGIHSFFASLPDGYNTVIGDGGMGLSGGQAQRLAIARALVRQPAVLILDEATSALDVESAAVVRDSIKSLVEAPGRAMTVLIITHNREMMEFAEHVVVLDQGRVVEEGEFAELVEKGGALAHLLSGGEWVGSAEGRVDGGGGKRRKKALPKMREVDWRGKRRPTQGRIR